MAISDRGLALQKKLGERFIKLFHNTDGSIGLDNNFVVPEGYKVEIVSMNGVKAEHLIPIEKKTDIVVLQYHGGAYLIPYMDMYRNTAVLLSEAAGGAEVYSIDYRVPPQFTYPWAFEDGIASYKYLLEKGIDPDKIILEGDSAGGNLLFSATLYFRDHDIPLPKLMLAWSPWGTYENDLPSRTEKKDVDIILGTYGALQEKSEGQHSHYAFGQDYKDPYVCPIYGDYHGFRNVLIQVGTDEILLDDSKVIAKKLEEAGANVTLSQYEGMFHTFLNMLPELDESKQAWEEVRQKIKEIFY